MKDTSEKFFNKFLMVSSLIILISIILIQSSNWDPILTYNNISKMGIQSYISRILNYIIHHGLGQYLYSFIGVIGYIFIAKFLFSIRYIGNKEILQKIALIEHLRTDYYFINYDEEDRIIYLKPKTVYSKSKLNSMKEEIEEVFEVSGFDHTLTEDQILEIKLFEKRVRQTGSLKKKSHLTKTKA